EKDTKKLTSLGEKITHGIWLKDIEPWKALYRVPLIELGEAITVKNRGSLVQGAFNKEYKEKYKTIIDIHKRKKYPEASVTFKNIKTNSSIKRFDPNNLSNRKIEDARKEITQTIKKR